MPKKTQNLPKWAGPRSSPKRYDKEIWNQAWQFRPVILQQKGCKLQALPRLQSEFKASLGNEVRPCNKIKGKEGTEDMG